MEEPDMHRLYITPLADDARLILLYLKKIELLNSLQSVREWSRAAGARARAAQERIPRVDRYDLLHIRILQNLKVTNNIQKIFNA